MPRGRVRQEAGEVARRLGPVASPELAGAGRNGDEEQRWRSGRGATSALRGRGEACECASCSWEHQENGAGVGRGPRRPWTRRRSSSAAVGVRACRNYACELEIKPGKRGRRSARSHEDEVLLGLSRGGVTTANRGGERWRPEDEEGPAPLAAVAPRSHGGAWTT